ncbi:secreted effector protein SseC [Cupriavidus gilardii J11]|uniref:Secreted effector protein SseC n=1 Tax=Cupriavidus gilardii J11 TaxID=936133 RepID=A0A562BID0_9BURK|nr:type III secretion system translocon subunit SctE [Cupriavidus gilardii]TWG84945.1 secreted effector protein SseC [Cupriavidus gilardii J11]
MIMESVASRHDISGMAARAAEVDPLVMEQAVTAVPGYTVSRKPSLSSAIRGLEGNALFAPPEPITDEVDARTAEEALQQVMAALSGAKDALDEVSKDKDTPWTLRMLGKATSSMMQFASTVLSPDAAAIAMQGLQNEFITDRVRYTMESIRDQRKAMAWAMEQKTRKEEEALQKQKEQEKKATKGQIICVVVSWASSALQVGMGIFKLATGQPTGALDVMTGLCGLARSAMETFVLAHPDSRPKLQNAIDKMAKAELAVGLVSAAIDIASAVRIARLAQRLVTKVCEKFMVNASNQCTVGFTLVNAIKNGSAVSMECAQQLARSLAKEVAEEVGSRLQDLFKLSEQLIGRAKTFFAKEIFSGNSAFHSFITKALSKASVERMVEDTLWSAAKTMAKKAGDLDNPAVISKLLDGYFDTFRNQLNRAIAFAVARVLSAIAAPMTVARAIKGSYDIAEGLKTRSAAKETERIQQLMMEVSILEFMMRQIQSQLKDLKKGMERETEEHTQNTEQISRHVRDQVEVKLGIADSMQAVGVMA